MRPKNFIFITVLLLACRCTVFAGNTARDATNEPLHENANVDIAGAGVGRATPNEDFQGELPMEQSRRHLLTTFDLATDRSALEDIFFGFGYPYDYLDCIGLHGTLSSALGSLTALRSLKIYDDEYLEGSIPSTIGSLTELQYLNLGKNDLDGFLPSSIGSLTSLTFLNLENNDMSGLIPTQMSSLTAMQHLDLDDNDFSGTLSAAVFTPMSSLQFLDLDGLYMYGSIPGALLAGLPSLQYLDMSDNFFSGSLPVEIGSLSSLQQADFEENYLSGYIPSELGTLTSLWGLDMSDNFFSGSLPVEIGSLSSLQQADFEENYLSGYIPSELGTLTSLWGLDLDVNSLSGFIPSSFGSSWNSVNHDYVELDLASNSLSGYIPGGLASIPGLDVLNLEYNKLSGTIPRSLGLASELSELTLQDNFLWGSIPAELGSLEGYISVSNNERLCGPTPLDDNGDPMSLNRDSTYGYTCPYCFDTASNSDKDYNCSASTPACSSANDQCAVCFDTNNGTALDDGCDISSPVCDPGAATCGACHNDATGTSTDTGCNSSLPICVRGTCYVCVDDKTGTNMDSGCNETAPYCGDGLFCGNCLDSGTGRAPDTGCTPDAPFCLYFGAANVEGRAGICSATAPPGSCNFEDAAGVTIVPVGATCPKELLVEAAYALALANCTTNEFNLKELMGDMVLAYFKTIPACAIESSLLWLDDARRRHLLQSPTASYLLLLRVYVGSRAEGQSILDVMNSYAFGNFLVETLNVNVAQQSDVLDVQASLVQVGAAMSDPHFTTPTGDKFDFNGVAGGSYCIITDKQVQVNARFVGAAASEASSSPKPDTRTWMDQVAIMHASNRILIGAASPAGTPFALSFGSLAVNGEPVIPHTLLSKLPSGTTVLRKKSRTTITIPAVAVIEVEVVRAGFWEAGRGPGKNFLNLHVKHFNGTQTAHGVLGQSFVSRSQVPAEGSAARYATSGIFAVDCQVNQFFVGHGDN
eukprot:jgi/Mesvir1/19692/Mv09958-RA.1